jgi:hypothetical protein
LPDPLDPTTNASSDSRPSRPPLPLERLVELLPDDGEHDLRWGARRNSERIPFAKPLSIAKVERDADQHVTAVEVETSFEGWSLNVAHGGMRIITEKPLRPGDQVQIEVATAGAVYLGRALVRWVREEADGVIAGLEFHEGEPQRVG